MRAAALLASIGSACDNQVGYKSSLTTYDLGLYYKILDQGSVGVYYISNICLQLGIAIGSRK